MEEVTYLSSRLVAKRRGIDSIDTRPAKRVQRDDDEKESGNRSSDGESSSDDEETSIGAALSTVHITPEPSDVRPVPGINKRVRSEEKFREPMTKRMRQIKYTKERNDKRKLVREQMQKYIDELEDIVRRNTEAGDPDRNALEQGIQFHMLWGQELNSKYGIWATSRDVLLKRIAELDGNQKPSDTPFPVAALEKIARLEIKITKGKTDVARRREQQRVAEGTLRSQDEKILAMQAEITRLKTHVSELKRSHEEHPRISEKATQEIREQELHKRGQMIRDQERIISQLQKSQDETKLQLQQRDAKITELKARCPEKKHDMDKSAVKQAQKQAKTSEARVKKMFDHYDTLHNQNVILIGKLTAMAQAGGFGNRGSMYRKELDALKAPSLEELKEFGE
ncbi:hypothetical protein ST47_g3418 [Ascochyta rabiei]|uniref:Uncharacterized protein n=2 Tax=Didymella rabiei TaxID=5454 RepID=A0A163HSG3_DIDRA|nr:hypothetical protein ST47_g3418 [Ascochyta rabiei]